MAPSNFEKVDVPADVDLENKQVYLAQVPADFDYRKAEFKSETEISCRGTTYFVNSSAALSDCDILYKSKDGNLAPSSTKLAGLLAFTKKVTLPKIDYDNVIESKPKVPQKENLRMRHFPTGYGPKSLGIDVHEDSSQSSKKHASDAANDDKPHKKRKKEKSEDEKKKKKTHKHKSSKKD